MSIKLNIKHTITETEAKKAIALLRKVRNAIIAGTIPAFTEKEVKGSANAFNGLRKRAEQLGIARPFVPARHAIMLPLPDSLNGDSLGSNNASDGNYSASIENFRKLNMLAEGKASKPKASKPPKETDLDLSL